MQGEQLIGIDLLTYSFPCQGLSIANMGRGKGIKEDADSTSNLIWQIYRILKDGKTKGIKLPKYLIMENVKALISKTHIGDYKRWLEILSELGYETNTIVLNGFEHGALQKRERVFGISIMKGKKWTDESFKEMFSSKYKRTLSLDEREKLYKKILNSSNRYHDEISDSTPNNTPSRVKMAKENKDLLKNLKWQKNKEFTFNTLTCKQDRHPNIGMISIPQDKQEEGKLNKRFITPREGYQIMGFSSADFANVKKKYKEGYITKESLYRQGGNSIVVSVLEDVFKFIEDYDGGKYV
ncbi:MAG: DNA (cytosine-5-)-methyltransferase [Mycoplasmataceae bacterium]|nr:DNA (cytosine-5-)-methyltransferase [Mycoplasmataceae bacterium]